MTKEQTASTDTIDPDNVDVDSVSAPTDSEAPPTKDTDSHTLDNTAPTRRPRSVSITIRGLAISAVIVVFVTASAVLGWLYLNARHQVDAQAVQEANDIRAEQIALDYAVNAATMNFKDLQAWRVKLVAGTTPELTEKLSEAGTSMEQVLVPLEWSSAAQPLVAKVRSVKNGIYVVDSFVSVQTKTVQAPEALQSTATYSTTIDSNNNWLISDVGGIGSAMGAK